MFSLSVEGLAIDGAAHCYRDDSSEDGSFVGRTLTQPTTPYAPKSMNPA